MRAGRGRRRRTSGDRRTDRPRGPRGTPGTRRSPAAGPGPRLPGSRPGTAAGSARRRPTRRRWLSPRTPNPEPRTSGRSVAYLEPAGPGVALAALVLGHVAAAVHGMLGPVGVT